MPRPVHLLVCAVLACSCASAGPWGHAPDYAPLDGEAQAVEGARELDPVMSRRTPDEWTQGMVTFFGVVVRGTPSDDAALLDVSIRKLAPRNLCSAPESDTCRVTVSDREFGSIKVALRMTAAEKDGPERMSSGSLLRLVGRLKPDPQQPDKLMLEANWHRHWPRGFYVTESFRDEMTR
jgi:hypothetical protein